MTDFEHQGLYPIWQMCQDLIPSPPMGSRAFDRTAAIGTSLVVSMLFMALLMSAILHIGLQNTHQKSKQGIFLKASRCSCG